VSYFFESDRAEQERMHRLHVTATLVLTHATLPGMVRRDRGSIINVSSVAAFGANPQCVSYNSTKAWMKAFTEGLHLELRLSGSRVRVQALCPGLTYTEFHQTAGLSRDEVYRDGPLWMTPQQVVDASLRGLERGCWLVVPGWRYRVLVFALNHLPRSLWHRLLVSVKRRRSPSLDRRSQNAGRS
jgi:short-subunit dehydrogenase